MWGFTMHLLSRYSATCISCSTACVDRNPIANATQEPRAGKRRRQCSLQATSAERKPPWQSFRVRAGSHVRLAQARVHSADYPSLQVIVREFLAKAQKPVDRACFA